MTEPGPHTPRLAAARTPLPAAGWPCFSLSLSLLLLTLLPACQPDPTGDEVTDYADLPSRADDYARGQERWGYLDRSGTLVISATYDDNRPFREGRAVVRRGGRFGYIDTMGRSVTPLRFTAAYAFHEGRARMRLPNDSIGFIDQTGEIVIAPTWEAAGDFSSGYAWARREDSYGYLNQDGRVVIPLAFSAAEDFTADGRAIVANQEQYGMIDTTGKVVVAFRYERLQPFHAGLARARAEGRYGFIDTTGSWAIAPAYVQCGDFFHGHAAVQNESGAWQLIDSTGRIQAGGPFEQLWYGGDTLWIAERQGKYGAIHPQRGTELPFQFDELQAFAAGRAPYALAGRWGYVATDGTTVTGPNYLLAWPYRNELARVALASGIGFIDRAGRLVLPPSYPDVRDFSDGRAQVLVSSGE